MAFVKFAENTTRAANTGDMETLWKVELYLDGTPPSLKTVHRHGGIKLVRGNASPKNKWESTIVPTYLEMSFVDEDAFIQNVVEANPDYKLMAIVYKDSSVFFKGFITSKRTKRKFKEELNIYSIKVYDGFNRLKDFNDFSALSSGEQPISTLLYEILSELPFESYIRIIMGAYPKTTVTPVRPADFIGFDVSDWLTLKDETATYYDLLIDILTATGMQIFSHANIFFIRQIALLEDATVYVQLINSSGVSSYSTANYTVTRTLDNLAKDPLKYSVEGIDEVTLITAIDEDANERLLQKTNSQISWEYMNRKGILTWKNPFFKSGITGWYYTGSHEVKKNSVVIDPYGLVWQVSGEIESSIEVEVIISTTVVRWMQSGGDAGDVPLYRIKAQYAGLDSDPPSQIYWLDNYDTTLSWSTSQKERKIYLTPEIPEYPGVLVKGFIAKYYRKTVVDRWTFSMPVFTPSNKGKIVIELLGGLAPVHNKPQEITAQHNYCVVKLKDSEDKINDTFPDNLQFSCKISDAKNKLEVAIPFCDEDPYLPVCFRDMNSGFNWIDGNYYQYKTQLWSPGDKPLLQLLSEKIIEFDSGSIDAYDVIFNNLPTSWTDFYDLVKANFDGNGETVFLPVYEERLLESHTSRMILIEHKRKTPTKTSDFEYVFGDN